MLKSSFWDENAQAYNTKYGLTGAVLEAYSRHHALVLTPDCFWQAILTQFAFYVNANAEALRDRLVDFKGKKILLITMPPDTLENYDYAAFAKMIVPKIAENIKDKSVVDWLLPSFTTTTPNDQVTACVSIMSTLQAFFVY